MWKISTALAGGGPETRAFLSNHYRRVEACHSNLTNRRKTFVRAVLDDVLVAAVGHGSGHSSVTVINKPPLCSEGQTVEKHFTTVLEVSSIICTLGIVRSSGAAISTWTADVAVEKIEGGASTIGKVFVTVVERGCSSTIDS